jgi:hypothetical protein
LPCLDITFIKAIDTKQNFEKKPTTHLEILMLGDFQNVKGFLFWIGSSSILKKKNLELESHPQYPPNSNIPT